MNIAWLLKYIGSLLGFLTFLTTVITYHPSVQYLGLVQFLVFGLAACGCFLASVVCRRLPESHWILQSYPVTIGLVIVATGVTVMTVLVAG